MVSIYQNIKIIAVQQNSMTGQNGIPTKYIKKKLLIIHISLISENLIQIITPNL